MNRMRSQGVSLVSLLVLITILGVFAVALMQLYVTSAQVSSERSQRAQAEAVAEAALAQASLGIRLEDNQQEACDQLTGISVTLNDATGEIVESEWHSGRCHVRSRGTTRAAERHIRGVLRGRGELLTVPALWDVTEGELEDAAAGVVTLAPEAANGPGLPPPWNWLCNFIPWLDCDDDTPGATTPRATLTNTEIPETLPTSYGDEPAELLPILSADVAPTFAMDVSAEDDSSVSLEIELAAASTQLCIIDINEQGEVTTTNGDCNAATEVPNDLENTAVVVDFNDPVTVAELTEITISVLSEAPSVSLYSPCLGRMAYCAAHTRPLEPWTWGYHSGD